MSSPPLHVVLMGMMGSGKTTVGEVLAERLGAGYADNDDELRRRTGRDAATVLAQDGVTALHTMEHDILADALQRPDRAVVGAPGSVALDPSAPALLAGHCVVWLRATLETLLERVRRDPVRPLLGDDPAGRLRTLMKEREPGFARLATLIVDVDSLDASAIAQRIVDVVPPAPGETA